MAENAVIKSIEDIQTVNIDQQNWISILNTNIQAIKNNHHYYCFGWLSNRNDCDIAGSNIQFNNVYGYCWNWDSGEYIVPEKGLYHVDFSIFSNNEQIIATSAFRVCILIDGEQMAMTNNGYGGATISGTFLLSAGQRIGLGTYSIWKINMYGEKGHNYFSIYQVCPIA